MKDEKTEHDLDLDYFEYVLLKQVLTNQTSKEIIVSGLDYLDEKLFKNKTIGKLIGIIKEYYNSNNSLPNWTEIKTRITDDKTKKSVVEVLVKLKEQDSEYNPKELIKNLEKWIKQRMILKTIDSIIDERGNGSLVDDKKAYAEFDKINGISLIDNLGLEYFDDEVIGELAEKFQEKENYLSTGYESLDNFLGGGFFQEGKALYTFGGETNIGKSIVVANLGVNVLKQNKNAVIISLEMSEFRYAKRISGMLTGIDIKTLSDKTSEVKELVFEFKNKQNDARLFIKEFPTKSITVKAIHAYLLKLQRQKNFKPDIIILDYHTLLKPSISQGSKHADMQFITQETRALTYLWSAPILSPLQLNRSGAGSNSAPELTTVAGSWDMLSDVDCHINIYQMDGDRDMNILRYSIKKARDGAKNDEGHWIIDYSTLRLIEPDDHNGSSQKDRDDKNNLFSDGDFDDLMDD